MKDQRDGVRRRPVSTRRAVLLLLTFAGCDSALDWEPDFTLSPPSGASCGAGWGGGPSSVSSFQYVCPTPESDAGLPLDASALDYLVPGSDPACALGIYLAVEGIPTVAVGEPFQLEYDEAEWGDAAAPMLPVEPAVATLARSSEAGVALLQPGYLAFFARQGSQVFDVTHVLARAATSLGLLSGLPGGPSLGVLPDAGVITYQATVGSSAQLLAYPQADDGTLLGGAVTCTFASSDPQVLAVQAEGVVAHLAPLAAGEATLTAACGGMQAMAVVSVTGTAANVDAAAADARDDAGTLDDAGTPEDSATDARTDTVEGPDAATLDAEVEQ
jgi:hypothetical protein